MNKAELDKFQLLIESNKALSIEIENLEKWKDRAINLFCDARELQDRGDLSGYDYYDGFINESL